MNKLLKSMDNPNDFPYRFDENACKICYGKCCRGDKGYIWVTTEELKKMADAKKMDVDLFSKQYARLVQDRLSLQERAINGEYFCCFFDYIDRKCVTYQSRPYQCRTFPFWGEFKKNPKELLDICIGVSLK